MPPLTLTIEVDDKGTPILRSFASTAQGIGQQFDTHVQQAMKRSTDSALSFSGALSAVVSKGAGLALGFAGVGGLAAIFATATSASNDFARALANANSLIPGQTVVQQQLREEILRLPPALGASKDIAEGLYAVLSAGIKPAEAVGFLATSANLARAGLSTLDTATTALTKTLQVYGLQTSDATRVSEVLFEVVNLGQGTLEQFAGALPNVLVPAKALGVSFHDVSAALAVLSNAFKSPSEAATGLRSLFTQLVANADEFALRGINIREVITTKGLLGAMDALQTLTQGNAQAMRVFIPDIEGQQAALTLLGAQYERFIETQERFATSQGNVARAVKEQSAPAAASLQALGNAILTNFEAVFKSSGLVQGVVKSLTDYLVSHTKATLDAADGGRRLAAQGIANRLAFEQSATAVGEETVAIERNIRATAEFAKALEQEKALLAGIEQSFKALKVTSQLELEELARGALLNFKRIRDAGIDPPERIAEAWEKTKEAILRAYGGLTPDLRAIDEQIKTNGMAVPVSLEAAYKQFGLQATDDMQRLAVRALEAFERLRTEGRLTPQRLLATWEQVLKQLTDAGFKSLPPAFAAANAAMAETARRVGQELPTPYRDAFQQIQFGTKALRDSFVRDFDAIEAAVARTSGTVIDLARDLTATQITAARDLGLISKAAAETATAIQQTGQRARETFGQDLPAALDASAGSLGRFAAQVDLLNIKFAAVNIPFATDIDVLRKQLLIAQRELADLLNGFDSLNRGPVGLTTQAFDDAVIREKRKLIEILRQKIDELAPTVGDLTGAPGSSAPGNPASQLTGGGLFGGSTRPVTPGIPLSPILSPAPFPLQGLPVGLPGLPLGEVPGPYTPTPLPTRTPPVASPGGTFTIPQVTGNGGGPLTLPGQPQFLSVPTPVVDTPVVGTTRGTIVINVNAAAITRNGADDLVQHLAPALRELQRQGKL